MKRLFLTALILLFSTTAWGAGAVLTWDGNTEPDLAGYKVYYDTDTGVPYVGVDADQGDSPIIVPVGNLPDANNPAFTVTGLPDNILNYFTVVAYDTEGLDGGYSNEASCIVIINTAPATVINLHVNCFPETGAE